MATFAFPGMSQTIVKNSTWGQCPQVLAGTARKVAKSTRLCSYTPPPPILAKRHFSGDPLEGYFQGWGVGVYRIWPRKRSSGTRRRPRFWEECSENSGANAKGQKCSGDPNPQFFFKSTAVQMGGVLPYKWEAYCSTNGKRIAGFPFLRSLEARKVR